MSISVVIPTHNRPFELDRAIASVLGQTRPADEIIVVDDCSQPPASVPDGVKLIRLDVPSGGNAARNAGVRAASSEYVAFLDDDDEMLSDKIEAFVAFRETSGEFDLISHQSIAAVAPIRLTYSIKPSKQADARGQIIQNIVGTTSMVVVRREFFREAGLFSEGMPARQDYEAWLRCLQAGARYGHIDKPLCRINVSLSNESLSKSVEKNRAANDIIDREYQNQLSELTPGERKRRALALSRFYIHKHVIAGNYTGAATMAIRDAIRYQNAPLVIMALSLLAGPRGFFKLLSLRSPA